MTDEELLRAFEETRLPHGLAHRDHVRLAWLQLRLHPPLEALLRVSEGLRRLARAHGREERYHETITWAYLLLVRDRLEGSSAGSFASFAAENPDLLAWPGALLERYYQPQTLASERARRAFVLPDRAAAAPPEP